MSVERKRHDLPRRIPAVAARVRGAAGAVRDGGTAMTDALCCCVSCSQHDPEWLMARDRVGRLFCLDCFVRFVKRGLWQAQP